MIYFTADTHFGLANSIVSCNRTFTNVEEMDKALIKNWNSRVSDKDTIYVTEDICMDGKWE